MGTIGDCYNNAPMESFWGSMQIEPLNRQRWMTIIELTSEMADYIENFYNPQRRQSSLNYLTPDEFEASVGIEQPETRSHVESVVVAVVVVENFTAGTGAS